MRCANKLGITAGVLEACFGSALVTPARAQPLPSAPPDQSLSYAESLSYGLAHNPQMRVASAQRDLALAKLIARQPGFRPDVNATADETLEGPAVHLPIPERPNVVVPAESHVLTLNASQIIFHAGQSQNQNWLRSETRSASAAYEAARLSVAHDVATAYFQVLQAREGLRVATEALSPVETSVATVQTLIQAQQAVQQDLLTAQSALAQVRQDQAAAQAGLIEAEANYNRTLGRPLTTPVTLSGLSFDPTANLPARADDAVKAALANRPDLHQLQADVEAARSGAALARLEGGPTITAHSAVSLQNPTALRHTTEWTVGASVSLPLMQSAQQRSDVAQAAAGVDAAQAGLEAAQAGDSVLALRSWQDYQTARSAETADAAAVAAQQEAVRALGVKRQINEATEADLAQARMKLEQAVSTATRDHYTMLTRAIDLQYEIGALGQPAAVPPVAPSQSTPSTQSTPTPGPSPAVQGSQP